jgi:CubicO group peptidase (beta-lactamase class C family)
MVHRLSRNRVRTILGLAVFIAAMAADAGAQPTTADVKSPDGIRLSADTPQTTANGATFTAPAEWRIVGGPNKLVLIPPEDDSRVALVDVEAADAAAAVAAGWASYRPDARRPLKLALAQATYHGWEERHRYEYETSPNEKARVYAWAWRAGTAWTVVIIEATSATFEKRGAALSLILTSLRPKGYQREMFTGKQARPLDAERVAVLTDFVKDVMRQFEIPGVGLSLIDGGRVVFAGGFGVKALGRPDPVDADTLFIAASNTKAMTTMLLAELVDEKKLRWDEPVREIYPGFKLGDEETTRQVLVKHLVCACTGLPRQDFEWLFNFAKATPASSLALLGTMQPTSRFGEVFQYSNLMAAAAGYVAAAIVHPGEELGSAYDQAMQAKVFGPLAMTHTTFDFPQALRGNFASPHGDDLDGRTALARMDMNYSIVPVRPAGGMWTSARDLSKYLQMELARGVLPDRKRLVSEENLLERRRTQIETDEDTAYGMGLVINRQYGIPIVHHGGSMFGYKSDMMFLPDQNVGAVILTNSDSGGFLTWLFQRRLLEVLFDGKPEAAELARAAVTQRAASIAKERERLTVPADPAAVARLAPRYLNPALGELRVRAQDGTTIFDFDKWHSAVASRKNDDGTTSFVTIDPTLRGFNFVVGERDARKTLVIRDAQHEYLFSE